MSNYPKPIVDVRRNRSDDLPCNACGEHAGFDIVVGTILEEGGKEHSNKTSVCLECLRRLSKAALDADKPYKFHTTVW